jgi:hypothetical protein
MVIEKSVYFMDIESTKFKDNLEKEIIDFYKLDFKLGCSIKFDVETCNEIEKYHTTNQLDFQEYLIKELSQKKKKIVYFHNLSFDSKFFIDFLQKSFSFVDIMRTGGKIPSIRCFKLRKDKTQYICVLEFRDSYSLLDCSLEVLGKAISIPKIDFDYNYESYNLIKAIEYCYNDCKIAFMSCFYMFKAISKNFNLINNRTKKPFSFYDLPLTIASLMKKIMRCYYPKTFYQVDKHIEQHYREYYFGGRTDSYNFNKVHNAVYLDVNSLYPSVMSNNDFINGKAYSYPSETIEFEIDNNIIAYECEILENIQYPLYPSRIENKIFYIKGSKKAILTKKEYNYFKENNFFKDKKIEIKQIFKEIRCNEKVNYSLLFNDLFKLRKKYPKENIYNYIFKKLMASAHGKFAEHYIKDSYKLINKEQMNELDYDNGNILDIDNRLMEKKEISNNHLEINLFNGILTTSYARFELWKMIQLCLELGIVIYYCDTDSLVISNTSLNLLSDYISESELGKWKIEQSFELFQALDSKEYYFQKTSNDFNVKFKGIKKEKIDTKKKLYNHYKKGTKVNIVGSVFYCMNRHSDLQNVHIIHKHKRSYYHKRIINTDLTTKPLTNNDLLNLENIELNNKQLILNHLGIKINKE